MNKIPLHYSILFPGIFQEPGKPIGTAILFCFQIFSSTVSAHHKWLLGGVNFDWFDDSALPWPRKWRCKFFLLCRLSLNRCNALKLVTGSEQVLCKYHLKRLQLEMPILPSLALKFTIQIQIQIKIQLQVLCKYQLRADEEDNGMEMPIQPSLSSESLLTQLPRTRM